MEHVSIELRLPSDPRSLVIEFDPDVVDRTDAEALGSALHRMAEAGTRFAPGETVKYGASLLRLLELPSGQLGFEELDYSGIPGQLQPGATLAMAYLRLQRSVAESVGLQARMDFPSLNLLARVCSGFDPERSLRIERYAPAAPDDTGFLFHCDDDDHDHRHGSPELRQVALYPLLSHAVTLIPFLALPVDIMVFLEPNAEVTIVGDVDGDSEALPFVPGSFLDVAAKRRFARSIFTPHPPFLAWLCERIGDPASCADNQGEVAALVRAWAIPAHVVVPPPHRKAIDALLDAEPSPERLYAACVVLAASHGESIFETVDDLLRAWKSEPLTDPRMRRLAEQAIERSRLVWDLVERTRGVGARRAAEGDPLIEQAFAAVRTFVRPEMVGAFERELAR